VTAFVDGYSNRVMDQGYRPQSAVPWAAEDVPKVVQYVAHLVRTELGLPKLLVARDLFCLTIMWNCISRGRTAVEWCLTDIRLQDGTDLCS
jgi:hypothetical protein